MRGALNLFSSMRKDAINATRADVYVKGPREGDHLLFPIFDSNTRTMVIFADSVCRWHVVYIFTRSVALEKDQKPL